ncbi:MAG: hypothetical protein U9Q40_04615 [Campylobacterota bacterium]|nr:hypothetical protein [Campylobacterota bacterium]
MELTLLIKSAMGLLVLLGLLIFFLVVLPKSNKKKPQEVKKVVEPTKEKPKYDMESLRKVVKDRRSSAEELKEALDLVLKYHGTIHKKLGIRPHPESRAYMDILFNICRHPNATKNLIIDFDKELEKRNPEYKKDINDAITRGLNSRGI